MDEMTDFQEEKEEAELLGKMGAERAMRDAVHSQGAAIGGGIAGQVHWSVTNQIRNVAFSSAMDIHRHRETSHDEIIASARAFEAYLKGD